MTDIWVEICKAVLGDEISDMTANEFSAFLVVLREKAENWDRFTGNPFIQLEANKQTDFLIECYDKLEAVKKVLKDSDEGHFTHARDALMSIEHILETGEEYPF